MPGADESAQHRATMHKIKSHLEPMHEMQLHNDYAFLENWECKADPDKLFEFGKSQLRDLGKYFHYRYTNLVPGTSKVFVRAIDYQHVILSAREWRNSYISNVNSHREETHAKKTFPGNIPIQILSDKLGCNNSLHSSCCAAPNSGPWLYTASDAQSRFLESGILHITKKLNRNFQFHNSKHSKEHLNGTDTVNLARLCAIDTLGHRPTRELSHFCNFFTTSDFDDLDYYESLGKYYAYSHGNARGPLQGARWA